ncbi:esterase [Thalassobaculum fulvum]|uniref:Esterase n=1 Tax=Thalassobaculum fulvum TaxID=1633335 RepID=A0A918XSG7_9PROT|nr:alpha/beta hydrolase family protein [Thalassobaculum fulvum]GHD51461.1 esterase [Thalassobaculum fulvum]
MSLAGALTRTAVVALALAGATDVRGAGAGTLETRSFASPALGADIPAVVYRPDRADGPLGVLYLLHGYGGGERDWGNAGVVETADAVFAEPDAVPLLIVMPGVGNSWYVDSARYGNWGRAVGEDLVAAVDAAYPTDGRRARRFVAGLSMGGYGALHLATHRPDRFRAAAALSPAIFEDVRSAGQFPDFQIEFFAGAFGSPLDPAAFNARNVFAPLVSLGRRSGGTPTDFYLMTGDHDSFGLWHGTLQFFKAARRAGHGAELRVRDGDHEWRLWREELAPVLRWIGAVIRADRSAAQ